MSSWYSILMSAALKSTVVLGAAWLVTILLRGRSAAARHLVWTAAAVAVLALPFFSACLPALRVPASAFLPGDTGLMFGANSVPGGVAPLTSAPSAHGAAPRAAAWHPDLRSAFVLLWAAGAAVGIAQMLLAYAALWRLRRGARRFADAESCRPLARAVGVPYDVPVLATGRGAMPMTFGWLRPAVFVPADAAEWSEQRCRMVLLHELAHVRRGDTGAHLIARIALSLHWWNPVAWVAWRGFLKERERAADDLVLAAGERASDYAGQLLEVARSLQTAPATAWAGVAMARRSQLEGRLLAILDSGMDRSAPRRMWVVAAAVLAVLMVAPFAAMRAQENAATLPIDVQAALQAADAQKNYQMLDTAASALIAARRYDEAQTVLESALTIRGQVAGEQGREYQAGLVHLGNLAVRRGKASPTPYYSKAVALGDTPEVLDALIYLGISVARKDPSVEGPNAADFLQRALNVAGSGSETGKVLTWTAVVREKQEGGAPEAESLFNRALALETPDSPEAALTMELYAKQLRAQSAEAEAVALETRAAAIRKAHVAQISPKSTMSPVVKVGGEVAPPAVVSKLEPSYTQEARAMKISGSVTVYMEVGIDGRAYNLQLKQGLGYGLDEAAVDAISQWQFRPATRDGQPVPVHATVQVNFKLL